MSKIRITFKSPDGVSDSLEDAGYDQNDLPEDVENVVEKFIKWSEYVTIELDPETGTAVVIEQ
jgi:hypothetical protein